MHSGRSGPTSGSAYVNAPSTRSPSLGQATTSFQTVKLKEQCNAALRLLKPGIGTETDEFGIDRWTHGGPLGEFWGPSAYLDGSALIML